MSPQTLRYFLLATLILLSALSARAQTFTSPISLSSSPSSPTPRTGFTVTASTPTFDKETALFKWTVDGKPRSDFSGIGSNQISLVAAGVGSPTRISVVISRTTGDGGNASLTVIPSELSLPWFADTSVPKWYRGKALPTPGADITVVAVPRIILAGSALNPDALIYRWRVDSDKESLVGAGKRIFRFTASTLPQTTHQIDVAIEDLEGRIRKEGRILLTIDSQPRIVIYPSSPLGGTVFRAARAFAGTKPGLFDVIAEPFFFPLSSLRSLTYAWDIDGTAGAGSKENPRLLTIDASRHPNQTIPVGVVVRTTIPFQSSYSGLFNLLLSQ